MENSPEDDMEITTDVYIPPGPRTAVLRIDFITGIRNFTPIASFTASLYKQNTMLDFLVTVENHIGFSLDLKGSFLCAMPIATVFAGQPPVFKPWQVILDLTSLINIFALYSDRGGVYMCQVSVVCSPQATICFCCPCN